MITTELQGFASVAWSSQDLRSQFTELSRQVASGQRNDSYAGFGIDARRVIDLRAERSLREALTVSVRTGEAFAEAAQLALDGISKAASGILDRSTRLLATGLPASDAQAIGLTAEQARSALREIVGLLGERFAGEAIFGGADPSGTPIVAPDDMQATGLFAQIGDAVRGLANTNGQFVLAATLDLAKSNDPAISPFRGFAARAAAGLEPDSRRNVPVGDGLRVDVGLYVYRNATVPTDDPNSTGSWARDLIRGLSIIGNFEGNQFVQTEEYVVIAQGALAALRAGVNGLLEEQGALGYAQQRLTSAAQRNDDLAMQLDGQISNLESVDISDTITRLMAVRSQMEASYRAIVLLADMTLTRFLR